MPFKILCLYDLTSGPHVTLCALCIVR